MILVVKPFLQPILLTCFVLWMLGCSHSDNDKIHHLQGPTMGTWYNVKFQHLPPSLSEQQVQQQIQSVLNTVNQKMSTYIDDSELMALNRLAVGKSAAVSADTFTVLEISQQVFKESGGAFDITVKPLVDLWGFGAKGHGDQVPADADIEAAMQQVGMQAINLQAATSAKAESHLSKTAERYMDLSAVAKGYAVDKIAEAMEAIGIKHYMVEVGGELRLGAAKTTGAWEIAIEEPSDRHAVVQRVLKVQGVAMATSGDYRNYFEKAGKRYSHTINPVTGKPIAHNLASVTVLHPSCAYADAYATALNVLGSEKGLALAKQLQLPVYMLLKKPEGGFEVLQTEGFQKVLQSSADSGKKLN